MTWSVQGHQSIENGAAKLENGSIALGKGAQKKLSTTLADMYTWMIMVKRTCNGLKCLFSMTQLSIFTFRAD